MSIRKLDLKQGRKAVDQKVQLTIKKQNYWENYTLGAKYCAKEYEKLKKM